MLKGSTCHKWNELHVVAYTASKHKMKIYFSGNLLGRTNVETYWEEQTSPSDDIV
jgi:hypothetical protein